MLRQACPIQDGGAEQCALISSCKSMKITASCWTTIDRRTVKPSKKDTLSPKTKKKPHQDGIVTQSWWSQVPYPPGGWLTNWTPIMPKTNGHMKRYSSLLIIRKMLIVVKCCEGSEPYIRLPRLGIQQMDWESSGNLTLKASGIWLQDFHRTRGNRDSTLGRHKILCAPRPKVKEQWPPQETETDLPASVGGSSVEACVSSGSLQGWGHRKQQSWKMPLGLSPLRGHH